MYEYMNKTPIVFVLRSSVETYRSGNNLITTWEPLSQAFPRSLTPLSPFIINPTLRLLH